MLFGFTEAVTQKAPARTPVVFFNTKTNAPETFFPIRDKEVRMYSCGPTVYNFVHIGNLRSMILSDTIRRTLEYNDYTVKQVINITDVGHLVGDADDTEDKMSLALKREGKEFSLNAMKEVGEIYTKAFLEDLQQLNVESPHELPIASDHINEQIAYIKTLDEKGYAYTTSDGVYFDTQKFTSYGTLSHGKRTSEDEHSRIGINREKHHPNDFALWKFNTDLGWESPWGKGFPGWHIECTAMSTKYLGKQFDIHTGGIDLVDIHHNNEIAQTEAATGKPFVNYWLHNAFISIEGQKVSKSLGNEILLRNIIDRGFSPLAFRYWLLTGHYRQSMNFTWDALEGAQSGLVRLYRYFIEKTGTKNGAVDENYQQMFLSFINDDLNTAGAIALLHDLIKDESIPRENVRATMLDFDRVLGIGISESNQRLLENLSGEHRIPVAEIPAHIQELVDLREKARTAKEWGRADELRDQIKAEGFTIKDSESGPVLSTSHNQSR